MTTGTYRPFPRPEETTITRDNVRLVPPIDRNQLEFLEIDQDARQFARRLWCIIEPQLGQTLDEFYQHLRQFGAGTLIPEAMVPRLKQKQHEHWKLLFTADFDHSYSNSARRVGIRHKEIELDAQWFISGYMALKFRFTSMVIHSVATPSEKGHLLRTLDKYVAVDMGLVLSTYLAGIVD